MATTNGTSEDTKTIVTVLVLLLAYPIGLIVMWAWPKWKAWIKILVTLPIFLIFAFFFLAFFAVIVGGGNRIERGSMASQKACNECAANRETSTDRCTAICWNLTPTIIPQ